jgi:hypothetical protein
MSERGRRRTGVPRRVGRILFAIVGGAIAAIMLFLVVASWIDLGRPRAWGTFTQSGCEQTPRGACRPVGTWVSDDAQLVVGGVYLDGLLGASGTARAAYQTSGIINGEDSDIVHTPLTTYGAPWLCGVLFVGWTAYVLHRTRGWDAVRRLGRSGMLRRRERRQT